MKEYFKQLLILYGALAVGQMIFAAVVWYLVNQSPADHVAGSDRSLFIPIVSALMLGAIFATFAINRTRKAKAAEVKAPDTMQDYRSLVIIRCALIEGASLFSLVVTLITNDLLFMLYFAGAMLVFVMFRPKMEEYIEMYGFTEQEAAKIRQEMAN